MLSGGLILAPGVTRVIRREAYRAWRGLRHYGNYPNDIQQEFLLHWIRRRHRHDADSSSVATFAAHVCRRRGLSMLETAAAEKRGGGVVPKSLSEPVCLSETDRSSLVLADVVAADGCAMRAGLSSRPAPELLALRLDVDRAVSNLPVELEQVARLLAAGSPLPEVAKRLNISRSTAYRRTAAIRSAFRAAGLDSYVDTKGAA
jgi:RNA polymerase sigma factor (sigma-70 family)